MPMTTVHLSILGGVVLLAVVGMLILSRPAGDPLPEMTNMPYAFITVSSAGYDPDRVTIVRGSSTPPLSVAVGAETAWPAYRIDDAKVVPLRDGQPYIFPLIDGQHSSPLPPSGRVLAGSDLSVARPYLTPEGAAMLQRFRDQHSR